MTTQPDEQIDDMTRSILRDDKAAQRVKDKVSKLGRPDLVTFTFPAKGASEPKRVSISFDTYSKSMAAGMKAVDEDGNDFDSTNAAVNLLSGAFIYATVRNAVIKQLEGE